MSKHGIERALERHVEKQYIEFVLNNPEETSTMMFEKITKALD